MLSHLDPPEQLAAGSIQGSQLSQLASADHDLSLFSLHVRSSQHGAAVQVRARPAAAAVSMMAGAYLDVESTKAKAKAMIEQERKEIRTKPKEEEQEIRNRLGGAGFNEQEVNQMWLALEGKTDAILKFEEAFELQIGTTAEESPVAHAIWMFLADLIAASIPVIPFAFFPLGTARWVSIGLTATLLIILSVSRAFIAKTNIWWTTIETLFIAALAGAAGVGIGILLGGSG